MVVYTDNIQTRQDRLRVRERIIMTISMYYAERTAPGIDLWECKYVDAMQRHGPRLPHVTEAEQ